LGFGGLLFEVFFIFRLSCLAQQNRFEIRNSPPKPSADLPGWWQSATADKTAELRRRHVEHRSRSRFFSGDQWSLLGHPKAPFDRVLGVGSLI
jgi:hypothetical protein